jgi:hypothetical protein
MKELRGQASEVVRAPLAQCFQLLVAVHEYPNWYPEVVQQVDVVESDERGHARKARTTLHVARGALVKDFRLLMAVAVDEPRSVRLTRIPHDSGDQEAFQVAWLLEQSSGTRISLELNANLSVPRFLPLGGIGESIARGFVDAATRALRG